MIAFVVRNGFRVWDLASVDSALKGASVVQGLSASSECEFEGQGVQSASLKGASVVSECKCRFRVRVQGLTTSAD